MLLLIKLDSTLGAAFIGNTFAAIFYGITNVQTFTYYKRNGKDPQFLKILIFILWILDGLHLALINHTLYTYTVKDFSDILAISVPTWSILAHIVVAGTSDLFVRSFFCHRVWRPFAVECFDITDYFELRNFSWILYLSFGAGLTADFIVAASLCWLLSRHRTGFRRTDSIIRVLMLYGINTCVLTTILTFCFLITFIKMPNNFVFIAFYFVMPKLFLNSLLATLNTRKHVREIGPSALTSIPLSAMSGTYMIASADGACKPQAQDQVLQIQIQTTTDTKSDSVTHINI
ncbi:hypothetical protein A0H81_03505 [Grifola frondosa]|uniref:DUF6534 domain-containing protein n=1 Tax=Grifola frondosa TaxID=5627 RepID=A0A1C7MM07_GRIFR|nr:hypothetical protein A0H81_03505 [Grifola frondosa]